MFNTEAYITDKFIICAICHTNFSINCDVILIVLMRCNANFIIYCISLIKFQLL